MLIPLKNGGFAQIDPEDFDLISQFDWYRCTKPRECTAYAVTTDDKRYKMHRILLSARPGEVADHIDGDGLNNRRSNLRLCTYSQNQMNRKLMINNTSGYPGVHRSGAKWTASIMANGVRYRFGPFERKNDAIEARIKAELEYFKEYSPTICRLLNQK